MELGKDNTEFHMQDRLLIAKWCYVNGDGVIRKISENGRTHFEITDYEALRGLFGKLLAEIQRIKSEGDYAAGKALVESYAVKIDYNLHKEVLERYAALEYPEDFLGQMLEYGRKYGTL